MEKFKKVINKIITLLVTIFITFIMIYFNINIKIKNNLNVKSYNKTIDNYNYSNNINLNNITLIYENKKIKLSDINVPKTTVIQSKILMDFNSRLKALNFAIKNGFSKFDSINYSFPELILAIDLFEKTFNKEVVDSEMKAIKNTGCIEITKDNKGLALDRERVVNDFIDKIYQNLSKIDINLHFLTINSGKSIEYYYKKNILRGSYKTNYKNSSESRKNNIIKALNKLDGVIIEPNESISFNKLTGERSEKNGYLKAKTIKNGTFYEEFGGGVCQVSTTFYNAAILANLEIIEVHPHSLPVGYIEPCFDAMVNSGSSDLIVKNNTEYPVIIATSSKNDECLVNIYGIENEYEIKRISKKVEEINVYDKEIIYDYRKVGLSNPLKKGEIKVISYSKPGFKARGILEYYKDGVLIKTKDLRENIYNPTKEVVLVG